MILLDFYFSWILNAVLLLVVQYFDNVVLVTRLKDLSTFSTNQCCTKFASALSLRANMPSMLSLNQTCCRFCCPVFPSYTDMLKRSNKSEASE